MKVALLTFHNTLNYGSALQVYASQEVLKNMGIDCEIIDYVNEHREKSYNAIILAKNELKKKNIGLAFKYFVGSLFISRRRQRFLDFYKRYTHCTNERFSSSKETKKLNREFDKFIVGSDQVWNYNHNGSDFAYFLDFVDEGNKKISYSSSFGLATIPKNLKDKYIEHLSQIKHLSTRENYGVKIIKELTGRESELVLDPVFLLNKEQWLSLCHNNQKKEKYIFCYTNRSDQLRDFLKQTKFPVENYKIYKLTRYLTFKDFISPKIKVVYSISPTEFIETIANAELIVSASFHCVAMSIILHVPFVVILTGDQGKDERILNILKITGLESRILDRNITIDDVTNPIDFVKVETKVQEYRKKSFSFLKNAIFS